MGKTHISNTLRKLITPWHPRKIDHLRFGNLLLTTWRNRSSRHQFRVRIIYHVIQTLDSAAKSFVSRLLLLFLLFDNMIEGKNGEMGKLQYIFKHGMTEYPKTRNILLYECWEYRNSEVLEPAPLRYHCYYYGYQYYYYTVNGLNPGVTCNSVVWSSGWV